MKKFLKSVLRLLGQMAIVAAVLIGFQVVTDGMWLFGLPELDQVESVSIAYPQVTEEVKTVTGAEDKELALKLTGFLKYNLFQKAEDGQQPLITITYHLQQRDHRLVEGQILCSQGPGHLCQSNRRYFLSGRCASQIKADSKF